MEQVEVSNMYIDMNVNNGSEKWTGKNTANLPPWPPSSFANGWNWPRSCRMAVFVINSTEPSGSTTRTLPLHAEKRAFWGKIVCTCLWKTSGRLPQTVTYISQQKSNNIKKQGGFQTGTPKWLCISLSINDMMRAGTHTFRAELTSSLSLTGQELCNIM